MANQNNDIEKYLKGELSPAEMHALEKKALHDPFLAEALEGAAHAGPENFSLDLDLIHRSVQEKYKKKGPKIISLNGWSLYTGIAAGLLLLVVSSFVILLMINQQDQKREISSIKDQRPVAGKVDTLSKKDLRTDTLLAANEEKQAQSEKSKNSRNTKPAIRKEDSSLAASDQIASAPVEEVIHEQRKLETEQVVEADLSEPPIIFHDEDKEKEESVVADKRRAYAAPSQQPSASLKSALVPERIVNGKVTSAEDGSAMPGVNVMVKGTNIGTVTDAQGNYQIFLIGANQSLVFNAIGLVSKEVNVAEKISLDVEMSADVTSLSEVVVTGYSSRGGSDATSDTYEMAAPQTGRKSYNKYLEENLRYPATALENKIEGRVTVQFTVRPEGSLADFKVIKGIGYGCDEELIRLIKEGPAWNPSKKNDQAIPENVRVRLKFSLPKK
jgi:TonB family protein